MSLQRMIYDKSTRMIHHTIDVCRHRDDLQPSTSNIVNSLVVVQNYKYYFISQKKYKFFFLFILHNCK